MGEEKKLDDIIDLIKRIEKKQEESSQDIDSRLRALELNAHLHSPKCDVKNSQPFSSFGKHMAHVHIKVLVTV